MYLRYICSHLHTVVGAVSCCNHPTPDFLRVELYHTRFHHLNIYGQVKDELVVCVDAYVDVYVSI